MKPKISAQIIFTVVALPMANLGQAQFVLTDDNRSLNIGGTIGGSTVYSQFQAGPGMFANFNQTLNDSGGSNPQLSGFASQYSIISSNEIYVTNHVGFQYFYDFGAPGPFCDLTASAVFEVTFVVPTTILCNLSGIDTAGGDLYTPTVSLKSVNHGTIVSAGGMTNSFSFFGSLQPDTYTLNFDLAIDFFAEYSGGTAGVTDFGSIVASCAMVGILPPAVTSSPASITAPPGGSATFNVTATGDPLGGTLTYQWLFNGTNIAGATNSSLALMNLTGAQAGSYSVVVSNLAGATPSSPAVLSLLSLNMYAGLMIYGEVGATYQIEYRNTLTSTNWMILTNIVLPSSPFLYIDPASIYSLQGFYRAVVQ